MTDSDLNTLRQGGEKIQQVEFESLYTGLHEVREISELQKKLELTEGEQKNEIPLLKSLKAYEGGSYSCLWNFNRRSIVENYKTKYSLVFPFLSQLKVYEYYNNSYIYFNIQNDSKDFFKIKKCFEDNNNYIFISNSGCIFTAKKEDFNSAGYMATSLKLISIPQGLGMGITNISDDDLTIKYYLNGNLEGTLQGQCFTYVNKSNNNDVIYVGNKSYIYKSTLIKTKDSITNKDIISHNEEDAIDLGLGEIKKITLDPKQNLLFVVSEDSEGNSNLHILDHKKIFNNNPPVVHEIKTIAGVSDVTILPDGDILLFKSDGKLDILNTNLNSLDDTVQGSFEMKKIKVNKAMNHTKKSVIDSLGTTSISIDNNKVSNEGSEEDIKIIERIRERPIEYNGTSKKLKEWLNDASSEEDIEMVKKAFLEIIKSNSNLNSVPDLLKQIEKEISNKKNEIVLNSIFSELSIITEELGGDSDLITLFTIKEKLRNIQKKRKNIAAGVIAKDKELKELLELVDEKIDKYQELHKEQLETDIESNLEKIKEFLDNVENAIDISTIYTTSIYKATEEMINYLNTEGQTRFKKKLKEIVQNRGKKIKEKSDKAKKEEADMIEHRKKDIEDNIAQIKEILEEIDDINTVETYKENDVFVKKTKDLLSELPSSDAQKLDIKLDRIFSERIFKLRLGGEESKGVIQNLDSYGIDTILYYNEDGTEKIEWKIEGRENANGTIGLVAKLMNGETHEYNKGIYLKDAEKFDTVVIGDNAPKFDMTFEEFAKFNKKLSKYKRSGKEELKELSKKIQNENDPTIKEKLKKEFDEKKEYYKDARYTEALIYRLIKQQKLNPRSKVPPFDPNYIVLDEEREILKELSARLVDQKQNSSIEILEGGPGLGKTVMCEFLANVTNREIIRVQCSKMDPSDMFFSPTLKKGETSREPADWIKLMQKPGTIILFDEIDKLNDQCFERLHSLFDRGRSVYDPQLGSIKANQDCLFIGTCNSYDKLSNPILSRGRILEITYPGELNEAFKISKYSTSAVLKKMSYEEFEMLYDKYITRGEPSPTNAQEKSIYELIQNINHLLNIFNKLRELYGEDDPFPYELSYRDARQIFVDYNNSKNFKIAMEHVLIPKAKKTVIDPDEKKTRESIIRQVINGEIN